MGEGAFLGVFARGLKVKYIHVQDLESNLDQQTPTAKLSQQIHNVEFSLSYELPLGEFPP